MRLPPDPAAVASPSTPTCSTSRRPPSRARQCATAPATPPPPPTQPPRRALIQVPNKRTPLRRLLSKLTMCTPRSPPLPAHPPARHQAGKAQGRLPARHHTRRRVRVRPCPECDCALSDGSGGRPDGGLRAQTHHPRRLGGHDPGGRVALRHGREAAARRPQEEEEASAGPAPARDRLGRALRPGKAHQRRGVPPQRRACARGPGLEGAALPPPEAEGGQL